MDQVKMMPVRRPVSANKKTAGIADRLEKFLEGLRTFQKLLSAAVWYLLAGLCWRL
jgi:hypothetical protein